MNLHTMTSLERVLAAVSHQEADRVPFFLLLSLHGAKELGMSIKEYFSQAEHIVEGQLRLRKKYRHDCIYTFFYASLEIEAWGGQTLFFDDGPPNAAEPIVHSIQEIVSLKAPTVASSKELQKVITATRLLKEKIGNEAPIIGVVMSPFSLPVMQLGFERYLQLIFEHPEAFQRLMQMNIDFCVEWANAQIAAGTTAICYFDPLASPTIMPRDKYLEFGQAIQSQFISRTKVPVAIHLVSGRTLPIIEDIAKTGAGIIGVSELDDLAEVKKRTLGKISVLGNLNGIAMTRWNAAIAEAKVRNVISLLGPGGGFILSDNHGEIPWQVSDEVLMAISDTVHRWGRYPIAPSTAAT